MRKLLSKPPEFTALEGTSLSGWIVVDAPVNLYIKHKRHKNYPTVPTVSYVILYLENESVKERSE